MIAVHSLSLKCRRKTLLSHLDFQIDPGDCLGIIGENGSGKSLLLKVLATLIRPTSGVIEIDGEDLFKNLRKFRSQIGFIPTTFDGSISETIESFLIFFAKAYNVTDQKYKINSVLELMELTDLRSVKCSDLSDGQLTRLTVAKSLLHDPKLLLIDNIFSQLDPRGQIDLLTFLKELREMKKMIAIATNRLSDVEAVCNRVLVLRNGEQIYFGDLRNDLMEMII